MYTIAKALSIRQVELVKKIKFATAALDLNNKIFVVHVAFLAKSNLGLEIYLFYRAQITFLKADIATISVSSKYANFVDVFSKNLIAKLIKLTKINNYAINLIKGQQPSYGPIYSLKLVELKILKTYIETNMANGYIKPSKSSADASILFVKKCNDSF